MGLPRFAVVDIETSGMSPRRNRILQIGVVNVDAQGSVLDEWSTMVRLRWRWSRVGPTHVHGITRPMLRDAPELDAAMDEFGARVDGAVFTAHNARFDGAFLQRALRNRPGTDPGREAVTRRLCTLRMSRRLDPERRRPHGLADLCKRYDVALDRPHDALADARATAMLLPHLLAEHGVDDEPQLAPFFDRL